MTTLEEDIRDFCTNFNHAKRLENTSFVITGGTGLIGSVLVRCLLALNANIHITLVVRNATKANSIFGNSATKLEIVACDMAEYFKNLNARYDYVVHCASPTNGEFIKAHPVETFEAGVLATREMLDYARRMNIGSMLFVSSIEYYGKSYTENAIDETYKGEIEYTDLRMSYPISKSIAEYLCYLYSKEYGVSVAVARLTQTFGAGVSAEDNRVFSQFAKNVINQTDIVLHTDGSSSKPYCYTIDSIDAMLHILLFGQSGEAYNVACDGSYISVLGLAKLFVSNFCPQIKIRIEEKQVNSYAPIYHLNLSTEKIKALGWTPRYDLKEMCRRLIASFKERGIN